MHRLGFLLDDYTDILQRTAAKCYVKTTMGTQLDAYVGIFSLSNPTVITAYNGQTLTYNNRHITYHFRVYGVPKKYCIKMFTHNWGNNVVVRTYTSAPAVRVTAPLTPAEAENFCGDTTIVMIGFNLQGYSVR